MLATVVGSSWMEAVFSTTSRHSSSLATPSVPRAIRQAARIPMGVAALPSPSRLADTLAVTAASVSGSRLAWGSSRRSTGRNSRPSRRDSPHRSMTSISPVHRHSTPAMERHSRTACPAPSSAAALTASMRPYTAPHTTLTTAIPVQIHAIAILVTSWMYTPHRHILLHLSRQILSFG